MTHDVGGVSRGPADLGMSSSLALLFLFPPLPSPQDLDKWIEGPPLRKKRSVVVCTVLGDTLYAIGGYDGQAYLSCAEMYDPERKIWVTGPEMQVARGRHCVCTLPF